MIHGSLNALYLKKNIVYLNVSDVKMNLRYGMITMRIKLTEAYHNNVRAHTKPLSCHVFVPTSLIKTEEKESSVKSP